MERRRQLLTVVLFGVGSGVAVEIAAQETLGGLTALFAILLAGSVVAGTGVLALHFAEWSLVYQVTAISTLALIGFVYWSASLTGPAMITSDLRVTAVASERELELIRSGAIGLLLLYGTFLLVIVKRLKTGVY